MHFGRGRERGRAPDVPVSIHIGYKITNTVVIKVVFVHAKTGGLFVCSLKLCVYQTLLHLYCSYITQI